jgi:phosphate:Na+ symporter
MGFVLSDLLTNFERVSDHCSNIAGCVLETAHGSFDMHEYLNNVKSGSDEFKQRLDSYIQKYELPAA